MTVQVMEYMQALGQKAREASTQIARAETNTKNSALLCIADELESARAELKTDRKSVV